MMPRITTDSGKTLEDVLQDDLFTHATVDYTDSDGVRHVEDVPVTRRGDSIVPPQIVEVSAILGMEPKKEGDYYVFEDIDFSKCDRTIIPNLTFAIDVPASHRNDPPTSAQAARSMVQGAQRHRVAILTALRLFGPATGHELAARLGMEYVQVAKRLTELAADGRINRREIPNPIKREVANWIAEQQRPIYQTRPSPSGRPACVWHLNPLDPTPGKSTEPA